MNAEAIQLTDEIPTVHIIDDDDAVRFALTMLVQTCGWHAISYASVDDFLARPGDASAPGCVILDLNMEGMTGADLLEGHKPSMPVIVITGYPDSPLTERARHAGVQVVLAKPFNDQVLLGHIEHALGA